MKKKKRENKKQRMEKSFQIGLNSGYMGMISKESSAPSNLPQEVVHDYYPNNKYLDCSYIDDSIKGIDDNNQSNISRIDNHKSKSMY